MRLSVCRTCGHAYSGRCPRCKPAGRAGASPSNRAQRDGSGDYDRNRAIVLAGNPQCTYCPRPATTVDHRIPIVRGGTHDLANLVPACGPCNSSKQARRGWRRRR